MKRSWLACARVCLLCQFFSAFAQEGPSLKLNIEEAVNRALANYPAVKAARAQATAARAGVDLARTAYLPKLDMIWQENRASRNNVFGLLLPQSTIPSMSGPVLGTTSMESVWGSAGGMLFSWEPFDFGGRKAGLEAARALSERADTGIQLTQLDVAASAADNFLSLAAAELTVAAASANLDRMQALATSVHALVDNQLRPGADASRVDADLAAARIQVLLAQRDVELFRASLAESMGSAGAPVEIDSASLPVAPPGVKLPTFSLESHPLARAQASLVTVANARERALSRSYYPRFNYQFALFGRGSGALLDGRIDSTKGLRPEVPNWATGLSITFPAFDIFGIRARRRAEAGNRIGEQARFEQVMQSLKAQETRALAGLNAAFRISENTPIQLKAAQETQIRARARYEAGLATIVEVADAQRLLAQAETDDAIARVNTWRALLAAARAEGDIQPFLQLITGARTRQTP